MPHFASPSIAYKSKKEGWGGQPDLGLFRVGQRETAGSQHTSALVPAPEKKDLPHN